MALAAGTRLGPSEIVAALGAGGMEEVYQARDTRLDRTVAIKVLPSELSADPERRARFEREARTIAALNHPHICTLYDVGEAEVPTVDTGRADLQVRRTARVTYLVMEHLTGETLAHRLRKGALPVAQVLDIGAQMAEALDAAHKQGIVHRKCLAKAPEARWQSARDPAGSISISCRHRTKLPPCCRPTWCSPGTVRSACAWARGNRAEYGAPPPRGGRHGLVR